MPIKGDCRGRGQVGHCRSQCRRQVLIHCRKIVRHRRSIRSHSGGGRLHFGDHALVLDVPVIGTGGPGEGIEERVNKVEQHPADNHSVVNGEEECGYECAIPHS